MTAVTIVGLQMQVDPTSAQQLRGNAPANGGVAAQHERDFADAVQRNASVEQIDAQPALTRNSMASDGMQRLDNLSAAWRADQAGSADTARRQTLFSGDPASAPAPQGEATNGSESLSAAMDKAEQGFVRGVNLSVTTELMSNFSSTVTKTGNSLMKGQ